MLYVSLNCFIYYTQNLNLNLLKTNFKIQISYTKNSSLLCEKNFLSLKKKKSTGFKQTNKPNKQQKNPNLHLKSNEFNWIKQGVTFVFVFIQNDMVVWFTFGRQKIYIKKIKQQKNLELI